MSLVIKSVTKRFSGVTALDSVSLQLDAGEIVGLIGPNGSGKTTLVNVITGLLDPDDGSIHIDGQDVTGAAANEISRAGTARTFQTVHLFAGLSVQDNVAAVIREPDRSIDELVQMHLQQMNLSHLSSTRAGNLPYGMQRRLEIARALATRPRYLFLDEPAAGLNDVESWELEERIARIPQDDDLGCAVLVIDHDLRLIMSLCDRIVVLANGKLIAEGSPEQVRRHPAVVEAYLGRQPA